MVLQPPQSRSAETLVSATWVPEAKQKEAVSPASFDPVVHVPSAVHDAITLATQPGSCRSPTPPTPASPVPVPPVPATPVPPMPVPAMPVPAVPLPPLPPVPGPLPSDPPEQATANAPTALTATNPIVLAGMPGTRSNRCAAP